MQEQPLRRTRSSSWLRAGALAGALALPLAALAQQAFTRAGVALMAGPGNSYPQVAYLHEGQPVDVIGCTQGYGWCDVVLPDGMRGWIYAAILQYPYQGAPVPLHNYGAVIGVPIVTFTIGNYWGRYYRDRPWYPEPRWWGGRPPPPPGAGWRPPPPSRPDWRPRPGPPPPNFRPPRPPAWQGPGSDQGPRPPRDPGVQPPRPGGPPHGAPLPGRPVNLGDGRRSDDNHGGRQGDRGHGHRGHGHQGDRGQGGDRGRGGKD